MRHARWFSSPINVQMPIQHSYLNIITNAKVVSTCIQWPSLIDAVKTHNSTSTKCLLNQQILAIIWWLSSGKWLESQKNKPAIKLIRHSKKLPITLCTEKLVLFNSRKTFSRYTDLCLKIWSYMTILLRFFEILKK